jgi:hypothetical protein
VHPTNPSPRFNSKNTLRASFQSRSTSTWQYVLRLTSASGSPLAASLVIGVFATPALRARTNCVAKSISCSPCFGQWMGTTP